MQQCPPDRIESVSLRGMLAALIAVQRSSATDSATADAAIAELAAARLVTAEGPVVLTESGKASYQSIRSSLEEITARLFDFPAEDLATAGRVLSIITSRTNAVLAGSVCPPHQPDNHDADHEPGPCW
jgi:hypothetical protein